MTKEVMQQALEALENHEGNYKLGRAGCERQEAVITAIKEALAQPPLPVQEPAAYDKTEMNSFVIDLYDKKMQEGKHGHYEIMFHVVHQAIKRATPPLPVQRQPLTDEEIKVIHFDLCNTVGSDYKTVARAIEAAHNIKEGT